MWTLIVVFCLLLSAAGVAAAVGYQSSATRPIGEGDVFALDTALVGQVAEETDDLGLAVRKARNWLDVEAVSIVSTEGTIVVSTSESLVGNQVANPLLTFGVRSQRFTALASPIGSTIHVDGIAEWAPGDVLYQVVSPLDEGSALIHYDLASLLSRRIQPGEVQTETLQLLGLAGLFALIGAGALTGRMRSTRRYRELAMESEILRTHSAALEAANLELETARSEAENALALAEEKMRIRAEFVLMINHELRTPLTSVVTGAEILRDGGLDAPDAAHVMEAMVSDGQRLQEIIDQILAVARIENRGLGYDLTETPLGDLCDVLRASHPALKSAHAGRPHPTNALVATDPNTLAIVVASLADNAKTHGASTLELSCGTEATIEPQVSVGNEPASAVYVSLKDNGPGIDPSFLPRAFEKFEKAGFSSGTGLGLYIVRLMIEALNASVGVYSSPTGSIFEIALPVVRHLEPAGTP